jgi:hypothetical protein
MRFLSADAVNRYDLLEPYLADYSTERAVTQQKVLFRMTGDPIFARYRSKFLAELNRFAAAQVTRCVLSCRRYGRLPGLRNSPEETVADSLSWEAEPRLAPGATLEPARQFYALAVASSHS